MKKEDDVGKEVVVGWFLAIPNSYYPAKPEVDCTAGTMTKPYSSPTATSVHQSETSSMRHRWDR